MNRYSTISAFPLMQNDSIKNTELTLPYLYNALQLRGLFAAANIGLVAERTIYFLLLFLGEQNCAGNAICLSIYLFLHHSFCSFICLSM